VWQLRSFDLARLSEKQVTAVTIAVFAALTIGLGAAAYYVNVKMAAGKNDELKKRAEEENTLTQKTTKQRDLENQLREIEGRYEEFKKILPGERDVDMFLNECIETNAQASGISVARLVPVIEKKAGLPGGKQAAAEPFAKVSYEIRANGEFHKLVKFMSLLENSTRFIKVDFFTIMPKTGSGTNEVVDNNEMSVRVTTFVLTNPPKIPASAGQPGAAQTPPQKTGGK
jgi:Tfp pilus assembly protein PilO